MLLAVMWNLTLSHILPARSGYRIQVDPDGNATRAIYYMERELANLDPSRPANYNRCEWLITSCYCGHS